MDVQKLRSNSRKKAPTREQLQQEREQALQLVRDLQQKMEALLQQAMNHASFVVTKGKASVGKSSAKGQARSAGKNKQVQARRRTSQTAAEDEEDKEQEFASQENQSSSQANYAIDDQVRLTQQPSILSRQQKLKEHQLQGLNWMISVYDRKINAILADDMGLGKTIQVIAMIAFLKEQRDVDGPHLIVAPLSTIFNWEREFKKWLPQVSVIVLQATEAEREEAVAQRIKPRKFDVIVTSYEGAKKSLTALKKIDFHYFVVDEAHKLKSEECQLTEVLSSLNYGRSILLTGTPLQNNLHELWAILNFIMPNLFTNSLLFDDWFQANQNLSNENAPLTPAELAQMNSDMVAKLHQILRIFMLRRTKTEVLRDLPPKKEIHLYTGLTALQVKMYQNLLSNRTPFEGPSKSQNSNEPLGKKLMNLLMQLRKVSCHPYLFPEVEADDLPVYGDHLMQTCGKMIVLDKLLNKLRQQKRQVLIFSQFTSMLNIIEDYCTWREFTFYRIDGDTPIEERNAQMEDFTREDSEVFLFLLSTRAGGLGINLHTADTVIIYDSDLNPQADLQAIDRAHRIGQKNEVVVYRLISEHTVEEKIRERQLVKLKWDKMIVQQNSQYFAGRTPANLSSHDIKSMLAYGSAKIFKTKGSTIDDADIEILLKRGEQKTREAEHQVDELLNRQDLGLQLTKLQTTNEQHLQLVGGVTESDIQALDEAQKIAFMQVSKKSLALYRSVPQQIKINEFYLYKDKNLFAELKQKQTNFEHYRDVCAQLTEQSLPIPQDIEAKLIPLTQQEQTQLDALERDIFPQWTRREFDNFLKGLYNCDSTELATIQAEYVQTKTLQEVQAYAKMFWDRLDQVTNGEQILNKVTRNQESRQKERDIREAIAWKVGQFRNADKELTFTERHIKKFCDNGLYKDCFSLEVDRALLCASNEFGNNAWNKIVRRLQDLFPFNIPLQTCDDKIFKLRQKQLLKVIVEEMSESGKKVKRPIIVRDTDSEDDDSNANAKTKTQAKKPVNGNSASASSVANANNKKKGQTDSTPNIKQNGKSATNGSAAGKDHKSGEQKQASSGGNKKTNNNKDSSVDQKQSGSGGNKKGSGNRDNSSSNRDNSSSNNRAAKRKQPAAQVMAPVAKKLNYK